jgi:exonuclease III
MPYMGATETAHESRNLQCEGHQWAPGVASQRLEMSRPDIACLQELKAPQEMFPQAAIEKAGYGAIWHGQKSWNGVAILARGTVPVETARGLPGDSEDLQSRYIETRIGGLYVGCRGFSRQADRGRYLSRQDACLAQLGQSGEPPFPQ